jgi:hypothetical protein
MLPAADAGPAENAKLVHQVFKKQLWLTKRRRWSSSGSQIPSKASPLR